MPALDGQETFCCPQPEAATETEPTINVLNLNVCCTAVSWPSI